MALAALDPLSIWAGFVVGGLVGGLVLAHPWSRGPDGGLEVPSFVGVWLGGLGPVLGGIVAGVVWLVG